MADLQGLSLPDLDALIGRWQAFADQDEAAIAQQHDAETEQLFADCMNHLLMADRLKANDAEPRRFSSSQEFAGWVKKLRANERGWSRHLGSCLLDAQTLAGAQHQPAAEQLLQGFADQCPWVTLTGVAEIELGNLRSSRDGR